MKSSSLEEAAMLKNFILGSLISADNDEYPEEVKQDIIKRFSTEKRKQNICWEYVFEPLGDDAEKYVRIMKAE